MNLDTAAIIGLSRKPLDEESQNLASQLMVRPGNPAEEALALLAAKSIAHRANLKRRAIQEVQLAEAVPSHPTYGILDTHIFNFLEASLAFRGAVDAKSLFDRNLVVPADKVPWYLEAVIRRANVSPEAYALLGRRGLWLSLKHPSFKRKVAFLSADTFPKAAKQREAYVCFWWSELLRIEQAEVKDSALINRFRRLFTASKLSPHTFGLLQAVLDRGVLAKAVNPTLLLLLFSRKRDLTDLEVLRFECMLDDDRKQVVHARARTVLSTLPDGCDQRDTFEVLAKAATSSRNTQAAATLLYHATTSPDRLIKGQNILPNLASVLDKTAYADFIDATHDRYPKGWRDPMVIAFISANPYPFSPKLSEDLANEVVHGYAPASETVAGRYPHKLNPMAFGHLLSLKQENNSESLNALVAMMLAKQRFDSAIPVF